MDENTNVNVTPGEQPQTVNQEGQETGNQIQLPTTAEELQKILQSEADRRVNQALEKQKEKFNAEIEVKVKAAMEEAARQAQMTAEEREKELLEQQRADIEAREKAIKANELKLSANDMLLEQNLPVNFRDFIMQGASNIDEIKNNLNAFKTLWDAELQKAIDSKLKNGFKPGQGTVENKPTEKGLGSKLAGTNKTKQIEHNYFK